MKIAQVTANDNLINSIANHAMDGETGIKDISNLANNKKSESACVYNQGDTLSTDGFGLFLTEEEIKGNQVEGKKREPDKEETEDSVKDKGTKETAQREGAQLEEKIASLDEETFKEVSDMEVTVEEYTAQSLDRAIARIASQRATESDNIKQQADQIKEENAVMEKKVISRVEERIKEELIKYGSSASKSIIAQIQSALAMSESVGNIDVATTNSLIRQKLLPTISNVYKSGYNHGTASGNYTIPKDLEGQIEALISESGLTDVSYLTSAAGAMLEERIPVTSETLKFHLDMKGAKEDYSQEHMLSMIAQNVAAGGNPMDTQIIKDEATKVLDTIEKMCKDMDTLSGVKGFLATRTLNEVRLAMTSDASIKMAVKNIDLDVSNITDALDTLKAIEEKLYIKLFTGEDISLANAKEASANMSQVDRSISLISYNKEVLVSATFEARQSTTIGNFENALVRYEESATEVRKDLGDSVNKAFNNIPSILEEMSLEPTQRNVRAVRELAYASMEITVDNVEQMKIYDMSFDTLVENLTPSVTKKLIENGINPLDMTVEELNEKALEFKQEIIGEDSESYAQFLYRMDKAKEMTKEMRDAYIGIYRLIKNVQNTDGAAVSTAYKAGMEMTLSNLLTCMRTYKSKGIDSIVSDEFGSVDTASLKAKGDGELTIDAQINKVAYYNRVVDKLAKDVSPQLIREYELASDKPFVQENIEVLEDMIESTNVKESTGYIEGEKAFNEARLNAVKEGISNGKESARLLQELGLEVNVGNLIQMHSYGNTLTKRVKNSKENDDTNDVNNIPTDEELDGIFEDDASLKGKLNQMLDEAFAQVESISLSVQEPDRVMQAGMLMKNITFSRKMMDKGCFEIPLSTDAGITNIRLQFARDEEKAGQVNIFMEDTAMGEVNVSIRLKGEAQIKGFIACETRAGYEFFARENVSLKGQFASQGIDVVSMDCALGRRTRSYYSESGFSQDMNEQTAGSNKLLLTAAKLTIRHIMKGIGEINENQS